MNTRALQSPANTETKVLQIAFVYKLKRARVDKARVTRGFKKKKDLPPVINC